MTTEAAPAAPVPRAYEAVAGPRGWPLLGVAPRLRREAFHRQLEGWQPDIRTHLEKMAAAAFTDDE